MNLPMEWLSEFTDVSDISIKDYCSRMTMTGSKVEGYEVMGEDISNVVAGKILHIEKHPDSDHLQICSIDCGEAEPRQIVTGAQNVFEGAMVPVAKAPAKLPGGVTIKKGKLRGVESDGMLCSIAELGLTLHDEPEAIEDGIFILPYPCKPGDDIHDVCRLSDTVVEFEITPNRPDCLSVIGLARETGVTFDRPVQLHTPEVRGCGDNVSDYIRVSVTSKLCTRYTARVVRNVRIAPSPKWMRARLRAAGVRPINNIVDITNYVMLEYGQPMHAFDYACLDGSHIIVREAQDGEQFRSLDDIDHTLRAGMLVIADEKKPVALAGVMGGANSEIKEHTATVVFESANFNGTSVRKTSRSLGMRTESSGRYEKGLDPENTMPAVQRACELVELLDAGDVVDGVVDCYADPVPQTVLKLEPERINAFLGVDLTADYMCDILRRLDFTVEGDTVYVPSFRGDVQCMNDIAEEVLRIYGYNTIQATPFKTGIKTGEFTPRQKYRQSLCDLLCRYGYYETCTFSFISPKYYNKIRLPQDDIHRRSLVIRNPLGEDTSVMRTTLLPSVLECLARNYNFKAQKASLFEIASVYVPNDDREQLPAEPLQAVLASYGGDFYDMKGVIEDIMNHAGVAVTYRACADRPTFHPGRCAEAVAADGTVLAVFGELHPEVQANYGLEQRAYAAVLPVEDIFARADFNRTYHPLPKYPALTRDIALICDEELEAGTLEACMTQAAGKLLCGISLFDIYRSAQLGEGKKSLAFSLSFRADDRTLTDAEADRATAKVLAACEEKLGAVLRR